MTLYINCLDKYSDKNSLPQNIIQNTKTARDLSPQINRPDNQKLSTSITSGCNDFLVNEFTLFANYRP